MKSLHKFGWLIAFLFVCVNRQSVSAQTGSSDDITWLGLDFSQAKFIGPASQFKDAGEITNDVFRDKYTVSWNDLFVNEQNKYDVAGMVHHPSVKYATDIAKKANSKLKKDFFGNTPNNFE